MTRDEKAAKIVTILEDLYPETPIPLDHRDPFTLLVAVLLSAQTTDKKVNEITPALFDRAPTPEAMAAMDVDEIRHYIRQIGLANTKAKALKTTATMLHELHGGVVPQSFEALEQLPGVGHKTASVVMAQAFGHPAFPVDTHIHRLATRWGLTAGTNVVQTEKDLKRIFAPELWNKLHLQIIFFGREYCPALYHDLTTCPICGWASTKKRQAEEVKANQALRTRKRSSGTSA